MKKNPKALIRHNLIYQKLQAGETVNVKDLADEFGVGVRDTGIRGDANLINSDIGMQPHKLHRVRPYKPNDVRL